MDLLRIVTEVIDLRSFSNLWYWIALAVLWSSTSHWVLGVPFDLIARARRQGGDAAADVEALAAINARRLLAVSRTAAVPLFFALSFIFTVLFVFAFWFWMEFAQAILFLMAPLLPVGWLSLRTALRIENGEGRGDALYRRLMIHRRLVQIIGMLAIFVTAMFGMWRNLSHSILY